MFPLRATPTDACVRRRSGPGVVNQLARRSRWRSSALARRALDARPEDVAGNARHWTAAIVDVHVDRDQAMLRSRAHGGDPVWGEIVYGCRSAVDRPAGHLVDCLAATKPGDPRRSEPAGGRRGSRLRRGVHRVPIWSGRLHGDICARRRLLRASVDTLRTSEWQKDVASIEILEHDEQERASLVRTVAVDLRLWSDAERAPRMERVSGDLKELTVTWSSRI